MQTNYYTKLQLPDLTDVLTVVFSAMGSLKAELLAYGQQCVKIEGQL